MLVAGVKGKGVPYDVKQMLKKPLKIERDAGESEQDTERGKPHTRGCCRSAEAAPRSWRFRQGSRICWLVVVEFIIVVYLEEEFQL